jgi:3-phosphoglycerate kinase
MNLPSLKDVNVSGKRVIVRMDFDVPEGDFTRIESSKETVDYLLSQNAKLILIGHKGRPEGVRNESLSLGNLVEPIERIIGREVRFVGDIVGEDSKNSSGNLKEGEIILLENLRFDKREEENDEEFASQLASLGEVYVNEAFATSHREHVSFVRLPKLLPHVAGFRFIKEIEHLSKIIDNPERPLIFLISGIKKDKLEMIERIKGLADKVLVGGRLPEYMSEDNQDEKVEIARLLPDKEDITIHSIEKFADEISRAKTLVLAGVVGKYEEEGHRQGTQAVFEKVAESNAYKVAGGGDTEAALTMFNLTNKFDWISVGGGAMLEFLAKGTLPGIEALR